MSASMPASFTGQYLYWGANSTILSREFPYSFGSPGVDLSSPFRGIARGVYACGVSVVGPCGILYHTLASTECSIESLFRSNNDLKTQLRERSWQHLKAAYFDCCGIVSFSKSVLMNTIIVACGILLFIDPPAGLALSLTSTYIFLKGGNDNVVYNFMYSPHAIETYLSDEKDPKTGYSQKNRYHSELLYTTLVRLNLAVEGPLTDELISKFTKLFQKYESFQTSFDQIEKPAGYMLEFGIIEALLSADRIKPERKEEFQFILSKKEIILKEHKSNFMIAFSFGSEETNEQKMLKYADRMIKSWEEIFKDAPTPINKDILAMRV